MKYKHLLLLLPGMMTMLNLSGQGSHLELTFTSRYYNTFIPGDSILVENLTQPGDTVLYYPDTVLFLDLTTGIHPMVGPASGELSIRAVNNGMPRGEAGFILCLPRADHISLAAYDLNGRQVAGFSQWLSHGHHKFGFTPGAGEGYLIHATGSSGSGSLKLINPDPGNIHSCIIAYQGMLDKTEGLKFMAPATTSFRYAAGDSLRYTVFAGIPGGLPGSDVLWDVPQTNKTYQFNVLPGLPCPGSPAVWYEGKVYTTVQIYTQCWFKENLNVGTRIPGVQNMANNGVIEKYCYGDAEDSCTVYGGLYQWDEMMQYVTTSGVQGICPPGWHPGTEDDWTTLLAAFGGQALSGGAMKEAGTDHWWASAAYGGTNASGFTALGGGSRYGDGTFGDLHRYGRFYGSTEVMFAAPAARLFYYDSFYVGASFFGGKEAGFSVRCMKN